MLYLFPNPDPLVWRSVLISSRQSEVWLWEEGRKEETRMYLCPGHAWLVLDSTELDAFQRVGDKHV